MLPSEALARATTFDLYVLDLSSKWQQHQIDLAAAKQDGKPPPPPKLSTDQMLAMLNKARNQE